MKARKVQQLKEAIKAGGTRILEDAKTVYENEVALFNLFIDHPVFILRVHKARKSLGLPPAGLDDQKDAFVWEHANNENKTRLLEESQRVLRKFNVPAPYRNRADNFVYDYVLCSSRVSNLLLEEYTDKKWKEELKDGLGAKHANLLIVRTHHDREINGFLIEPDSVYFKVNPEIRFEDLVTAFKQIRKVKQSVRPFYVPKSGALMREIWRMRMSGISPKVIIYVLRERYANKKKFNNHFVDVNTQRYKKALSAIYPLPR